MAQGTGSCRSTSVFFFLLAHRSERQCRLSSFRVRHSKNSNQFTWWKWTRGSKINYPRLLGNFHNKTHSKTTSWKYQSAVSDNVGYAAISGVRGENTSCNKEIIWKAAMLTTIPPTLHCWCILIVQFSTNLIVIVLCFLVIVSQLEYKILKGRKYV